MLPQPALYTSTASGAASPGSPHQAFDPSLEQFIRQGFLVLPPAGSLQLHDTIYSKAWAINARGPEETWKLADGVLAAIPELQQVLEVPHVRSALTNVLGEGYMLHGHRHLHVSSANNQMWHKDSYWGFRKIRKHRPRWLMMLYYPQDTIIAMGPTCIMAGSQYWTKNTEHTECGEDILLPNSGVQSMFLPPGSPSTQTRALHEAKAKYLQQDTSLVQDLELTVPAGTCVLMHYDLFHRASSRSAGSTAPERFLVKFQFLRTTEPCLASAAFLPIPSSPAHPQLEPILGDIRAWYCGIQTEHCNSLLSERAKDAEILSSEASEVDKVAAAYRLGRVGARQLLARALTAEDEGTARAAAYGLTASGPSATASVLPLLTNASNRVRRHAAFVVGETAKPEASTVTALGQALQEDSSKEAKCELLEAIGLLGARARSLGQDELCNSCMQHVLPFLEQSGVTWAKTQTGECAAYAILLTAGLRGQVPPQVLAKLATVANVSKGGDHLMATFAAEVLRRNGTAVSQIPCLQFVLPGAEAVEPPAKRPSPSYTAYRVQPHQPHPVTSMLRSPLEKAQWARPEVKEVKVASYVVRRPSPDPFGQDFKVNWPAPEVFLELSGETWQTRMDTSSYVST